MLGQYRFRYWPVACSAQSHCPSQCSIIVNWTLGTNFNEIWIEIQKFSFTKMHLKMSSGKWRSFCLRGDELTMRICNQCCFITNYWIFLILIERCFEEEWLGFGVALNHHTSPRHFVHKTTLGSTKNGNNDIFLNKVCHGPFDAIVVNID